ncbi:MAG: cation diffusion facilitator family transporter [Actinomycetota bacterium]|nr:cation diffusion facilitator family transporter [Actinomycetota bacterium]
MADSVHPHHDAGGHQHDGHGHDGHGHAHHHGISANTDRRRLAVALALLVGLMAVEVVAGIAADSLALLSDAAHMLTDAGAIVLALLAIRLAARPASGDMTFGFKRTEIMAAQLNGATLLVLGAVIAFEGVQRLMRPPDTDGAVVLAVALLGVAVNLAATLVLAGADRRSLNVEGAFLHVLTDLVAFIATAIAGAVILLTDFTRADGIASLFVAAIMVRAGYGLLKASARVFLEAAPKGLSPDEIGRALAAERDVVEVHDLHVWEVTSGFPALSAHVLVPRGIDCHAARQRLEHTLGQRFGITHTTLQMEHEGELLSIGDDRPRPRA